MQETESSVCMDWRLTVVCFTVEQPQPDNTYIYTYIHITPYLCAATTESLSVICYTCFGMYGHMVCVPI
jgi:hypothetical protein